MKTRGSNSGRVLANWPTFINVGPNSSRASLRWMAAERLVSGGASLRRQWPSESSWDHGGITQKGSRTEWQSPRTSLPGRKHRALGCRDNRASRQHLQLRLNLPHGLDDGCNGSEFALTSYHISVAEPSPQGWEGKHGNLPCASATVPRRKRRRERSCVLCAAAPLAKRSGGRPGRLLYFGVAPNS